jgi:hypothetical protein
VVVFNAATGTSTLHRSGIRTVTSNFNVDYPMIAVQPDPDGENATVIYARNDDQPDFYTVKLVAIRVDDAGAWGAPQDDPHTTAATNLIIMYLASVLQLGPGVVGVIAEMYDDSTGDTSIFSWVVTGNVWSNQQTLEADINPDYQSNLYYSALGETRRSGDDWQICLAHPKRQTVYSVGTKYYPTARRGTYSAITHTITWEAVEQLLSGADVAGAADTSHSGEMMLGPMGMAVTEIPSGFAITWVGGLTMMFSAEYNQIWRSEFNGTSWSAAALIYDLTSGMLDGTNLFSYSALGHTDLYLHNAVRLIHVNYFDGAYQYLLIFDSTDARFPYTNDWTPYFFLGSVATVIKHNYALLGHSVGTPQGNWGAVSD